MNDTNASAHSGVAKRERILFSVIIPCFNTEAYIKQTLESVLAQSYTRLEVLIVDDASTDRTISIAEQYARLDPRIRIFRCTERSGGPAAPRNRGISSSKGEYIAFLDADDIWSQDKLLNDARFLERFGGDILFSGAYYFRERTENVAYECRSKPISWRFLFRNRVPFLTVCVNRNLFSRDDLLFDPDPLLVAIEDYHFLLSAYLTGVRILSRPGIDAYYRLDAESSISRRGGSDGLLRRVVYSMAKICAKYSVGIPTFLFGLTASVGHWFLRRIAGRV